MALGMQVMKVSPVFTAFKIIHILLFGLKNRAEVEGDFLGTVWTKDPATFCVICAISHNEFPLFACCRAGNKPKALPKWDMWQVCQGQQHPSSHMQQINSDCNWVNKSSPEKGQSHQSCWQPTILLWEWEDSVWPEYDSSSPDAEGKKATSWLLAFLGGSSCSSWRELLKSSALASPIPHWQRALQISSILQYLRSDTQGRSCWAGQRMGFYLMGCFMFFLMQTPSTTWI